ncbi:hypothetical protein [Undibacterium flavidum]|uniref:Histone H1/5 n=1 Tax=Undibacterium flavidum TaxID=2762297 RepID=A0ABR6YDK7_9BURK|nr:hypothetical protein [Undibacterium flavidum]MBC3874635.1 hypothetical protein [Undibacterium flavidum]
MATAAKKKATSTTKAAVVPAKSIIAKAKAVKAQAKPVAAPSAASLATVNKAVVPTAAKVATKTPVAVKAKVATPSKPAAAKKAEAAKKIAVPAKPVNGEAVAKEKHKKPKLVRDSFTMPEAEYAVLGEVKKACIAAGIEVKKSQLLRVGLQLLKKTPVSNLKTMIAGLQPLKAGRPKLN